MLFIYLFIYIYWIKVFLKLPFAVSFSDLSMCIYRLYILCMFMYKTWIAW